MAEQKILISIKINDREAANTQKQLKVTKDNFNSLTDAEKAKIVADKQLALSAKAVDKELTRQAAAANAAAAATDNMRATSGLNNAIIMETSRLASDASFGFTAIANNLSQLVNLVQLNTKATGSFTAAIKGLFTIQSAFLIGIQLLITYGSDLYESFSNLIDGGRFLKQTFKDAGNEVQSTAGKFEIYIRTLQDSSKSQEEQQKAIKGLNKEFPEYIKQLDDAGVSLSDVANKTEEAAKQNDIYRESLVKLALSKAAENKIIELAAQKIDLKNEADLNAAETLERVNKLGFESIEAASKRLDALETEAEYTGIYWANYAAQRSRLRMALENENREELKDIDNKINQLIKYTIIENNEVEKGGKNREKIERELQRKLNKIRRQGERDRRDAAKKINEFQKRQDQLTLLAADKVYFEGLLKLKKSVKDKEITEEEFAEKVIELDKFILEQEIQVLERSLKANIHNANERLRIEAELADKKAQLLEIGVQNEEDKFGKQLEYYNALAQKLSSGINELYDAEISREERKTELLNNQLKKRLSNEKLSASQREAINNQIEANEIALAEKRNEIAEKQFKMNKAASIANALVDSYAAGASVLKDTKGGTFARISGMFLVISAGLAQVAAIARQQFVPSTPNVSSVSAAGGSGRAIQAPDFNVVGASQTSQLAEVVAGQQAKPVRAFVVGKDVSTQQELDRNITNTASFG